MVAGTIKDIDGFDSNADCETLRAAFKGMGTNEAAVIQVVANRSNSQRQQLKKQFAQMFGKDLIKELKSELGGKFEDVVLAMFKTPAEFDAWVLHDAMSGAGTNEKALIEVMCSRTNAEIEAIKSTYKGLYKSDLAKDLQSDTSGHFKRLMFSLVQAARNEGEEEDLAQAGQDAQDLFDAGAGKWGTDESRFNVIIASRSYEQLQHVMTFYQGITGKTIEQAVDSEMSGDIRSGLLAVVKCARSKPAYFAERLYKSMKGAGTDDKTLIRIMVSRSEIDLADIKVEFHRAYQQTLEEFIADDCSGDYKRMLLAICSGN